MSRFAITVFVLAIVSGCTRIPKGAVAVNDVSVEGNDALSSSDIEDKLATTPSPKFLGLFRGIVYEYQIFDRAVLQRDLERVERVYRARGFYEAKARAGRVDYISENHVEVTIEVEEGPRVFIREISVDGLAGLPPRTIRAVRAALAKSISKDDPFEEDPFEAVSPAMTRALTDRGHAWAKVEHTADVDLPAHAAHLRFVVRPGPLAKFGKIKIQGLKELPEKQVRTALNIDPGDRYSTVTIDRAREALLSFGTFSIVEITPELGEPPPADAIVNLHVRVEEQKLRSIVVGGGFELDAVRMATHLHVGWEHKNLFGGLRNFKIDAKPGVVFYPTRVPTFDAPTAVLPAERFSIAFRQPGFIEARTNGVITQQIDTFPTLLSTQVDAKAPVLGYFEYKGAVGLERSIWKLFASPTYNLQYDLPFAYSGKLDTSLQPILVSYVDMLGRFDFRDNPTNPHKGVYIQDDMQFAGIGGDALDFRIQPEVRGYIPLGSKVTLALRSTVGFVFPFNYGEMAARVYSGATTGINRDAWTRDLELIYLRGFFSGGSNSNRGYPLRGVGPHGVVPFFSPDLEAQTLAQQCQLSSPKIDPIRCGVPVGGLSLWEASIELRFPIIDPFGSTVFCDASDVAPTALTLRFDYPHLSCGLGLRYGTPIGPVRLDLGVRIPGAQIPADADPRLEGDPGTFFGAPIAFAFGLGEAF